MTNPDTKWANQSRCSVMVSDLLSTVVGGTLWSISICGHLAGQSWSWGFAVPSYLNRGSAGHSCPGTCSAEHGRLVRWSAECSCFGRGPAGHSCFDRHLAGEHSCFGMNFAGKLRWFGRNPGGNSCSVHQKTWKLDKDIGQQSNAQKIRDSQLHNYHNGM